MTMIRKITKRILRNFALAPISSAGGTVPPSADYAGRQFREFLAARMPLCLKDTGGSFWFRKL